MNIIILGASIFNTPNLFCISILLILIFISFSNFEIEATTVDVTVIEYDDNFVRVLLDVYGYVPNDSRLTIKIETTSGQLIKKTFLNVVQKSDSVWGAQLLFPKSSSDSDYKISAFNDAGHFMGSINISLNDASQSLSSSTSSSTLSSLQTSFGKFTITTDKNSYSSGETIVITGEVKDQKSGIPVSVTVYAPNNNLISIAQIDIGVDKKFSTKITTGGSLWKAYGTYIINAQYGSSANAIETSFYFDGTTNTVGIPQIPGTQTLTSVVQPKTTYHNTFLSLQVQDGTNQGYIKVKPTLTYGLGGKLSSSNISIYVDGNFKTKVTSNQLSSDIYAGSGSHTIKASIPELTSSTNNLIKYRSSSDTNTFFVKSATSTLTSTPTSSNVGFPVEYVIVGIIVIAVIAGVAVALSKRKKTVPVMVAQPAKVQTASDDTQFWVCPRCGRDIQMKDGKQYCPSCNVYL